MKITSIVIIAVFTVGQFMAGCARQINPEQVAAFKKAVDSESLSSARWCFTSTIQFRYRHAAQAVYLQVVAMDPSSAYGKAAAERIEQLNRQLEVILGWSRR